MTPLDSTLANTSPIQFVDAVIKRWMHSSMCGRSSKTGLDGIRERDSERPLLRIVLRVSGALNRSNVDPLLCGGMPKVLGFHLLLITFITTRWLTYRTYHRGIKKTDIHLNSWFNLTLILVSTPHCWI